MYSVFLLTGSECTSTVYIQVSC